MTERPYAEGTKVPVGQSKTEIEKLLTRYGADGILQFQEQGRAILGFRVCGRHVRFDLPLPEDGDEKETRRRWRCLVLVLKSKLESTATGITTFEEEFLAHIVLPDGHTVAHHMVPQIEQAYQDGGQPKMLPYYRTKE